MRYGILSDIHGNLHALRAVLDALAQEKIDGYLCLGDIVGYGPFPNECAETVAGLSAVTVAGNHELVALGSLSTARCSALARHSLRWTSGVLTEQVRRYLAALPLTATVPGILLAHGSPGDVQEYVTSGARADELLSDLSEEFLLLGHTHQAWAHAGTGGTLLRGADGEVPLKKGTAHLLNPGSVGQSRDRSARARFLVLDLAERRAEFRSVRYDVAGCRAALRRAGLPDGSHHIRPPRFERVRRRLGLLT